MPRLSVWVLWWVSVTSPVVVCAQSSDRQVDSLLRSMTLEQKVGQLLMIPVRASDAASSSEAIARYQPGAVLIVGGTPGQVKNALAGIQRSSVVPVLGAIHAEWGPGQVLDSAVRSPMPMILAAAHSDSLSFLAGRRVGRQLKEMGLHLNFAVNADTDVPGPTSTVSARYYSDDPRKLVHTAGAWMRGLRRENILGVLKHIPGSQETERLDVYRASLSDLSDAAGSFAPFRELMQQGADGVLTSWLHYAMPDGKSGDPAPLAGGFIPEVMRDRLGFEGLVIAESDFFRLFRRSRRIHPARTAFQLGHDVILIEQDMGRAFRQIRRLARKNKKFQIELDNSVRRVLSAKARAGLFNRSADAKSVLPSSENHRIEALNRSIRESAATVVWNTSARLPIQELDERRFIHLQVAKSLPPAKEWSAYVPFESLTLRSLADTVSLKGLTARDVVVAEFTDDNHTSIRSLIPWLRQLDQRCRLVVVHYGNPYELVSCAGLSTVVEGFDAGELRHVVPQMLFGALGSRGDLPVRSTSLPEAGARIQPLERLSFGPPELAGMSSVELEKIDAIVREAIEAGATPGARVVASRRGRVIVDRSYGWQSYDRQEPVQSETVYDLASVTKVTATLQTTMFLYDRGVIDLYKKASVYLPELRLSNKSDFTLKDILTHQSGLWPFLPFWSRTVKDSVWLGNYYSRQPGPDHPFPVADGMFAHRSMRDSLWQWIRQARIGDRKDRIPFEYRYSDMGFYILQHLAERLLNQPMEDFLEQNVYGPMGASSMGYLPLRRFRPSDIAPTEYDRTFRGSLLRGYVHDQGAAMHGGVAGHAGLFSNAYDLAKLGQMWLRGGYYGGHRYFSPETVQLFTRRQYATSRRGLGWDKPLVGDPNGPTGRLASPETFGHTGFTGTCIWVDPIQDLVFVFLSNRVHPDMTNNKLLNANIRPRIHDVLYQSILTFDRENPSLF